MRRVCHGYWGQVRLHRWRTPQEGQGCQGCQLFHPASLALLPLPLRRCACAACFPRFRHQAMLASQPEPRVYKTGRLGSRARHPRPSRTTDTRQVGRKVATAAAASYDPAHLPLVRHPLCPSHERRQAPALLLPALPPSLRQCEFPLAASR